MRFLLFYAPKPKSQVWILVYWILPIIIYCNVPALKLLSYVGSLLLEYIFQVGQNLMPFTPDDHLIAQFEVWADMLEYHPLILVFI